MQPVFVSFHGEINKSSTAKLCGVLDGLLKESLPPSHVHLGFDSNGGVLSQGLLLFSFLDRYPIELTTYNLNFVASSAVFAFLGAKHRRMFMSSLFYLHPVQLRFEDGPPTPAEESQSEENRKRDEDMIDQILKLRLTLSDDELQKRRHGQLREIELSQALDWGLVNEGNAHSGFPQGPNCREIQIKE
jgi:ATP-dependent protease ClpP protease subunit